MGTRTSTPRDQNSVPHLVGTSYIDGTSPVPLYADPATNELMGATSSAEGVNTETDITGALWSSNTWTGATELNTKDQVGVSLQTDEAGTLFFDFSVDGTNFTAFPTNGFSVTSGVHEFHTAVKLGRYFRPRFVGTGGRSYFRLFTYYGNNFLPANAPVNQQIATDADATIVRLSSEQRLDMARGFLAGYSLVHKFGANPSISSSSTEDITFSGAINWLTAATTVRVKSGGNAADVNSSGAGARTITVVGLNSSWAEVEEDIALAGGSASAVTTTTFIRINRAYVKTVGTYSVANTGNITIENGSGGTNLVVIEAGVGQTQSSAFTVPVGKTAYLTRISSVVDANKAVTMRMFQRRDADDVTVPFTGKRMVAIFPQLIGQAARTFESYPLFPAKTDLWWAGTTGSGNTAAAGVNYDLILVDD